MKKGFTFLNTGYVYAPYVPMAMTPIIHTPGFPANPRADVIKKKLRRAGIVLKSSEGSFSARKGLATRYAHKQVQPSHFSSVTISDRQEQVGQTTSESVSKDLLETDVLGLLHRKRDSL